MTLKKTQILLLDPVGNLEASKYSVKKLINLESDSAFV